MIHATAIVHPRAEVDPSAEIGPYTVVDEAVIIGRNCRIGPQVYVTGQTEFGTGNVVHAGCVIGGAPQDLKYAGMPTRLEIGNRNIFREHVTIHRSNGLEEATTIGSGNYFMVHSHAGHNCRIGDHNFVANGVLIAGHAVVADQVFLSGNCLVHQFVSVGRLAMMQGGAAISKDLPPFVMAYGDNGLCGLNTLGLRRAGVSAAERRELKRAYRFLYRKGLNRRRAIKEARAAVSGQLAIEFLDFVEASTRGVCAHLERGKGHRARATPPR